MLAHLVQTVFQGTVVDGVANTDNCSAKKIGLQRIRRLNLFAGEALQGLQELGLLRLVQRSRRENFRLRQALTLLNHLLKRLGDFGDGLGAAMIDDDEEKIAKNSGRAEIQAAERAARLELQAIAAKIAVDRAETLVAQQMTPATQESLFNSFVLTLQGRLN